MARDSIRAKIIELYRQGKSREQIYHELRILEISQILNMRLTRYIYQQTFRYSKKQTCFYCQTDGHDNIIFVNNQPYCRACFERLFFRCVHCNQVFQKYNNLALQGLHGLCCQECFDARYQECEECGSICYLEDIHDSLCRRCYNHDSPIRSYSYQAPLSFYKEKWENTIFMGVELEVEPSEDDNIQELAKDFTQYLKDIDVNNKIVLKEDGSISGFEIVSQPFTLQFAKNLKFYQALKWLSSHSFTSYDNGSCGMHVHLGKEGLTKEDIIKLRTFFSLCSGQLEKLSNRQGKNTSYCEYEAFNLSRFKRFSQEGRYNAFNINTSINYPKNTVEIRIFRGTLNYKRFLANLQFCDALVNFIRTLGLSTLINYNFRSWDLFKDFLRKENRYQQLEKLLKKERL